MTYRGIPFHIERSCYVISKIRHENSLSSSQFADRVRQIYAESHLLAFAPSPETVRSYLLGRRPIPFESRDAKTPSYLAAVELAFPGAQHAFFHPLFSLLAGPVSSSSGRQASLLQIPPMVIDRYRQQGDTAMAAECEAHNEALLADKRRKRSGAREPTHLQWIHCVMYAIEQPVREILFTRDGLGVKRRRYGPADVEAAALLELDSLDALAAIVGIFLEGREIDDLMRMVAAKRGAKTLLDTLRASKPLQRIYAALDAAVMARIHDTSIRGVNLLDAMRAQYPATWGVSLRAFRMSQPPIEKE